jgi:hypothetical protein
LAHLAFPHWVSVWVSVATAWALRRLSTWAAVGTGLLQGSRKPSRHKAHPLCCPPLRKTARGKPIRPDVKHRVGSQRRASGGTTDRLSHRVLPNSALWDFKNAAYGRCAGGRLERSSRLPAVERPRRLGS